MRFSEIFAALLVAPLVAAHGDHIPGMPKIVGLRGRAVSIAQLKSRNVFEKHVERAARPQPARQLNARQGGLDGQCGPAAGGASCDEGYCCSGAGYCGQGDEYCMAPDCQFNYGPACDANIVPSGGSTKDTPRPQLGSVAYGGEGVYPCTEPGTVAITYDDGPYVYTNDVLDQFAAYGMKATFFMTGVNINKGSIDDESLPWPAIIRRMIAEGHQVASHTWSHQDLSLITSTQRYDQMVRNEMAIANVIGKFPTYMRPPYSSCTAESGCEQDMADLGYVVSYFNLDSDDYNNITPELIQNAKDRVANAINPSNPATDSFLGIAHDIHQQTAQNLTGYWLDILVAKGYRGVTMGECLGEPEANWYRTPGARPASSSAFTPPGATATVSSSSASSGTATSSAPTTTATVVSTDGSCGGTNGYTCAGSTFGDCCSQYGWCGSTADHCDASCNPLFGTCPGSSSSSSVVSASSTASASASGSAPGTSSAPTSTASAQVSTDGTCGGANGYTCSGSTFGDCCSQYGWCGSTADHCTNCNAAFGTCTSSSVSSLTSVASSTASSSASSVASSSASSSVTASSLSSSVASSSSSASSIISGVSSSSVSSTVASSSAVSSTSSRAASTSAVSSSSSSSAVASSSSSSSSVTRSSNSAASSAPTSSSAVRTSSSTRTTSSSTSIRTTSSIVTSTRTSTSSSSTRTSSSATPSATVKISANGKCGKGKGGNQTCKGSDFGSCCRFDGKCGNGMFACGWGCQKKWGKCW